MYSHNKIFICTTKYFSQSNQFEQCVKISALVALVIMKFGFTCVALLLVSPSLDNADKALIMYQETVKFYVDQLRENYNIPRDKNASNTQHQLPLSLEVDKSISRTRK